MRGIFRAILLSVLFLSCSSTKMTLIKTSTQDLYKNSMSTLTQMDVYGYDEERFEEVYTMLYEAIVRSEKEHTLYAPPHFALAYLEYLKGNYSLALEHIDRALVKDISFTKAYLLKFNILVRRAEKNWEVDCDKLFETLYDLEPPSRETLYNKALFFKYSGRYDESSNVFAVLGDGDDEFAFMAQKQIDELSKIEEYLKRYPSLKHLVGYESLTRDIFAAALTERENPFQEIFYKKIMTNYEEVSSKLVDLDESMFADKCRHVSHTGYIVFKEPRYFYPNKKITKMDMLAILTRVFPPPEKPFDIQPISLNDIAKDDKKNRILSYFVSEGVFEIDESGFFYPLNTMSVIEFLSLCDRAKPLIEKTFDNS